MQRTFVKSALVVAVRKVNGVPSARKHIEPDLGEHGRSAGGHIVKYMISVPMR